MSGFNSRWLFSCVLLLPALCGCHGNTPSDATAPPASESKGAAPAVRVETVRPERKTIRQVVEQPAQIKSYEETPVYAKVAGYVRHVSVDIGSRVQGPRFDPQGSETSAGQVLLQLWIPEVEEEVRKKAALLAQAEAMVVQARAAVRVAEAAGATAEAAVKQAQAAVQRTAAQYDKWQSELRRFVDLAAKAAVTQKLVDETRNQLAAADADRQEAQAKCESAQAVVVESAANLAKAEADLVAAHARVRVAEADRAKAEALLQYGTIRAPFDGIVTRRNVHTGHLVQSGPQGEPLLVLMRTDVLRIAIDVPENDAELVKPGQEASIRIPALGGETLSGKIARTGGSLDVATPTLRVEIDAPNQDGKLLPGLYAYASIVVGEHHDALVLPASAVLSDKSESQCSCVQHGKIVRKKVSLGLHNKSEVEILSGLRPDEAVIRVNSANFTEGQSVEAKPFSPPKP